MQNNISNLGMDEMRLEKMNKTHNVVADLSQAAEFKEKNVESGYMPA